MSGDDRSDDDNEYAQFAELSQYVTALVLYPIVSLIGMAGSALCIAVLSQRQMLTSTNVYLIALAVADLMKLANDFLYFPATLLQMSGSRRGGAVFAHLYPYAFFLSQYTSGCAAWLTVVVAGERCLMVTHPNWSRYTLTVRKSRIVSAVTYASVMLVTWPYLFRYETLCDSAEENVTSVAPSTMSSNVSNISDCTWKPAPSRLWSSGLFATYSKYYVQFQSCLKSLVPLLILIVLNVRIVMAVRETRANKKLASRNRVTLMLVMVILCYIVFTMPDSALSAMGWGYTEVTSNLRRGIREISDLLLAVNSSVNFFLYVAFNRVFRQNLLALCCKSAAGPIEGRQQTAGFGPCGDACSRSILVSHRAKKLAGDTACGSSTVAFAEEGRQNSHRKHGAGSHRQHRCERARSVNRCSRTITECGVTSAITGATTEGASDVQEVENDPLAQIETLEAAGSAPEEEAVGLHDSEQSWNFRHGMHQQQQPLQYSRRNRRHRSTHHLICQQQRQSAGELLTALLHPDRTICPTESIDGSEEQHEDDVAMATAGHVQVVVTLVVHHRGCTSPTNCDGIEESDQGGTETNRIIE